MAQSTPQDVHIDTALSNIAIGYKNDGYVADKVFPIVPTDKQSDYYYIWTKDFWFRDHVKVRGPGGAYPEGGMQLSNQQFFCINKGLSFPLPRETTANQDAAVDIEAAGAEWLADQFSLDREIALAAAIMNASAWTSYTTLSGTSQWSDYANSDPISDVDTGIQAIKKLTGSKVNVGLCGQEVWDKLKSHPDLLDRYKHTQVGILTEDLVAKLLGLDRIIVGSAVKNTSAEGAAFSGSYIWPKNMLLMYVPPKAGLRVPASGYTFVWKQTGQGLTVPIRKVAEDLRNRDVLLGDHAFQQKVTGADLAYEIITAVA